MLYAAITMDGKVCTEIEAYSDEEAVTDAEKMGYEVQKIFEAAPETGTAKLLADGIDYVMVVI